MTKTSATQAERYERFRQLHERPEGFVMPNAWDAGSAKLFASLGFQAIATRSIARLSLGVLCVQPQC